ncbi:MAG: hypothetical protein CMB32_07465 [Euryarchaeota archaeon]|nr:hypothetical protein [Euryarchaeota archaeon]|tara:strand:+ start:172 stop:1692 length:1521 start_codon:yes stop_codon:yes gene_type:complete
MNPKSPLLQIILFALCLRIISAFYSEGYLMHDDHFWVVESSASWADGEDYNNWLPWSQEELGRTPTPHYANLFYSSIHYLYFEFVEFLGFSNPNQKALILRLIHGLLSLIPLVLAYKISEKIGGIKPAIWVGFMMAGLAWTPLLSVHQLVEVTCIIPLLAFSWILTKHEWTTKTLVIAGMFLGIATGLRYQVGIMGLGLVAAFAMTSKKGWIWNSIITGISALFFFALTQIPTDIYLWGEPFAQLRAYIEYNLNSSSEYPQGSIFTYLFVILMMAAPPISFFFFYGYLKSVKKYAWLVLPSLAFIVFHSLFPNKQERFIIPALPYIIIVGTLVWHNEERNKTLSRALISLSIIINVILLAPLTVTSKNTSQLKAMNFLREAGDVESFLYVKTDGSAFPPRYYLDSWISYTVADEGTVVKDQRIKHCHDESIVKPNYLVFVGDSHLGEYVAEFKEAYQSMEYVSQFGPTRADRFLNYLNPRIALKRSMIYKIDPTLECSEVTKGENE